MEYREEYTGLNFGPYEASFSTPEDCREILALVKRREKLDNSKRFAVYDRPELLKSAIKNGYISYIARVANNEEEFRALGNKRKRIVAITGAYPLGSARISTETAKNRHRVTGVPLEIGTGLAIHEFDLPNADGKLPSRSFFKCLVALTPLNLFNRAGETICGRTLNFDTIVCNVQNRQEMRPIESWLRDPPLNWVMIERPSKELIEASSATTADKDDFMSRDKRFFELPPASLPSLARYVLDSCNKHLLVSDHFVDKNLVHIDINLPADMVKVLQALKAPGVIGRNERAGYYDLRRRIPLSDLVEHPAIPAMSSSRPVGRHVASAGRLASRGTRSVMGL